MTKKKMISDEKFNELCEECSLLIDLLKETMRKDWVLFEDKVNKIYNAPINPITNKSPVEYFKERKLTYNLPLSDILSIKDEVSYERFKEIFPLTVGELLKVTKGENETEQHALVSLCVNELSPRGYALKRLLL